MAKKVSLFLDSGAYSALSKGVVIDIDKYIKFIKDHEQFISLYANLDVIDDEVASYNNWIYMRKKGLSPLPVFHFNEDVEFLLEYLKYTNYICLGGITGIRTEALISWLDNIWSKYLIDSNNFPNLKVHAFGITAIKLIFRYPWYSVDSTSWVMTSRFGAVFIPRLIKGEYKYDKPSWKITFSLKSPSIKEEGKHYSTLTQIEKKEIDKYLKSKGFELGESKIRKVEKGYKLKDREKWFGKEDADSQRSIYGDRSGYVQEGWQKDRMVETIIAPGLCNDYKLRDELNIIYYKDLEASMPKWPWPFIQSKQTKLGVFS